METKFQTSFIPKKPLVSNQPISSSPRKKGGGVFSLIAILVFIASIAGAGFSVLWQQHLLSRQKSLKENLIKTESSFNLDLIQKIKNTSVKINLSNELLKNRISVTEIFNVISRLTTEDIRFTSFDFSTDDSRSGDLKVVMKGRGRSYSSVAFQSDVLGKSEEFNMNRFIKNPIVSDLSVDQTGGVTFTLTASVSASDVRYEKIISGGAASSIPNQNQ